MRRPMRVAKATILCLLVVNLMGCPGDVGRATFDLYVVNATTNKVINKVNVKNQTTGDFEEVAGEFIGPGKLVLIKLARNTFGAESGRVEINILNDGPFETSDGPLGPGPAVALFKHDIAGTGIDFDLEEFEDLGRGPERR